MGVRRHGQRGNWDIVSHGASMWMLHIVEDCLDQALQLEMGRYHRKKGAVVRESSIPLLLLIQSQWGMFRYASKMLLVLSQ